MASPSNGGIIGKSNLASFGKGVTTTSPATACVTLGAGTTIVQATTVTGGGGGGGEFSSQAEGYGGSGIVVIRWITGAITDNSSDGSTATYAV